MGVETISGGGYTPSACHGHMFYERRLDLRMKKIQVPLPGSSFGLHASISVWGYQKGKI